MPRDTLGEFERVILFALVRLRDDAYGVSIRRYLSERLSRDIAIGAVYTTLQRLEEKGYVSSRLGDPTPSRGGRAKRYFYIEAQGAAALNRSERQRAAFDLQAPLAVGGD